MMDLSRPWDTATIESRETATPEQLLVFDRDALLDHLGGDVDLMGQILERYLDCLADYLDLLPGALFAADVQQVRIKAHLIKGAAINIGALQVSEAARQLEMLARGGKLDGAVGLLNHLMSSVDTFRRELSERYGASQRPNQ